MDIDSDGSKDLLVGSYGPRVEPLAGRFQVLRGKPDGTFHPITVLNGTDGEPLVIRHDSVYDYKNAINTRPTACDWNGDGKLDLIVGNSPGHIYLFEGQGEGKFHPRSQRLNDASGKPLAVLGGHSDPVVVDFDGDGDLDLLSGSGMGHVVWAENRAKKGDPPRFKPFEKLIEARGRTSSDKILREEDVTQPCVSTRICVDDVNSDGKLDVLVGDLVWLVSPAGDMSDAECEKHLAQCRKELNAVRIPSDADPELRKKLSKQRVEIYAKRNKAIKRDAMGSVWLYLQK